MIMWVVNFIKRTTKHPLHHYEFITNGKDRKEALQSNGAMQKLTGCWVLISCLVEV